MKENIAVFFRQDQNVNALCWNRRRIEDERVSKECNFDHPSHFLILDPEDTLT